MLQARSSAANVTNGITPSASKQPIRFRIVNDIRHLQNWEKGSRPVKPTPAPNQGTLLAGKRLHPGAACLPCRHRQVK
jgi:hypothetical protein